MQSSLTSLEVVYNLLRDRNVMTDTLNFVQFSLSIVLSSRATMFLYIQEAAYTAAFSLACLKIRSRNEEAINSARNETDLLAKCFLLPTLSTSILFTCF